MKHEVQQSSDRGMDPASTINFLSNEDTSELAPGFFIFGLMLAVVAGMAVMGLSLALTA